MENKFGCNRWSWVFSFCVLFCASFNVFAMEGSGVQELLKAAQRGDVRSVEQLLARKDIDVNQADKNGYTALMNASASGHAQVVERLLACKDIKVNLTNKFGKTALIYALEGQYHGIVMMLQNHESMRKAPIEKSCFVTFTQDDHSNAIVTSFIVALTQQTIAICNAHILKKSLQYDPGALSLLKTKKWTLFVNALKTICVVVPDAMHDVVELNNRYGFSKSNLVKIDSENIEETVRSLRLDADQEHAIRALFGVIDKNSPQRPTRFLLSGHGAAGRVIANIASESFGLLLKALADIGAEFLYIDSCEVAGTNLLVIQKQINKIIEDNLRQVAESLKPARPDYTIVIEATSDVDTGGTPNISGMFTQLNDFYKQTSPEGLRQRMQHGSKRLTMDEVIRNVVPDDPTALASIRFPGSTTFFRAADLGDMKIITALDVQKEKMKMPLEIIKLKQYGESLRTLKEEKPYKNKREQAEIQQTIDDIKEAMQQIRQRSQGAKELVIPIASNIKYIQLFSCDALGFTLELQGKDIPKFISKIPGGAQHFIGKITYKCLQSTPARAIKEFVEGAFLNVFSPGWLVFDMGVVKSNKCWFIKSIVLNVGGVQESFNDVAIFIEAPHGTVKGTKSYMYYYQNTYAGVGPKAAKTADAFKDTVRSWARQCQPSKEALIEATAGHEDLDTCAQALEQFLD